MSQLGRKQRARVTRRGARIGERVARTAITIGGIGTIVAVSLIFLFLVWTVIPLFRSARIDGSDRAPVTVEASGDVQAMGVDEERRIAWSWHAGGDLEVLEARGAGVLRVERPFGDAGPTSQAFPLIGDQAVFGFADGSVRVTRFEFTSQYIEVSSAPAELSGLEPGDALPFEGGMAERTQVGQIRLTQLEVEPSEPIQLDSDAAVISIDQVFAPTGHFIATLQADGSLALSRVREREDMMTGEITRSLAGADLSAVAPEGVGSAAFVRVAGLGNQVFVGWPDGRIAHFDVRNLKEPRLVEVVDVVEDPAATLTRLDWIGGRITLVAGDSEGGLATWFAARPTVAEGEDDTEAVLVCAHQLQEANGQAVVATAASPRSRLLSAAFADGTVRLYQSTLGEELLSEKVAGRPMAIVVPPKQDTLLIRTADDLATIEMELFHPEVSLKSLFYPVPYEGYAEPQHSWESSAGTDDFEPKLGLVPLVFGTLKATLYSMLFGAPLAILAALYTSEFMHARLRSSVKATVELMASLPSVVLGFLAALVIAPYVQEILPAVLTALFSVPLAILAGAYLWQLLPANRAVKWSGWQRFLAIGMTLPVGVAAAVALGPVLESLVFGGDAEGWLDGRQEGAAGGWTFLLLPLVGVVVALLTGFLPKPKPQSGAEGRRLSGRASLLRFAGGVVVTLLVAMAFGFGLDASGFDPRGGMVGTYVQRNALIVGFAMGFAIVPIIYTLAEDALSEVPSQLREGSLGAGATQWQTAVRIVIPFAMSGLFSAVMIGLGRAVGETMVVLMAAGNTAILDLNIFNGFRTLSANIATEMPEAVRGSAHYRTLFLAALVLFAMTFVLNTAAELVRRHFRKRTQAL